MGEPLGPILNLRRAGEHHVASGRGTSAEVLDPTVESRNLVDHQRAPFAQTRQVVPVTIRRLDDAGVVADREATIAGGLQKQQNMHGRG